MRNENQQLNEEDSVNATRFLLFLMVVVFVAGLFVIIVKPTYRIKDIEFSNQDYYPHISTEKETK